MKKIIYSLVIMIAAGCLFTSCVENTVDQGRQDLLKAKASYLDALSNLRAADAEKVKAEAALVAAQTAIKNAKAAQEQAIAQAMQIKNTVGEAAAKAKIDSIKAAAEIAAVEAQQNLAEAQAELDTVLRNIAAQSYGLTQGEKNAIGEAAMDLYLVANYYNDIETQLFEKKKELWNKEYDHAAGYDSIKVGSQLVWATPVFEDSIAAAQKKIATYKALLEAAQDTVDRYAKLQAWAESFKDTIEAIKMDTLRATGYISLAEAGELAEANIVMKARIAQFARKHIVNVPYAFPGYVQEFTPIAAWDYNVYRLFKGYVSEKSQSKMTFNTSKVAPKIFVPKTNTIYENDTLLNGYRAEGAKSDSLGLKGVLNALKRDMVLVSVGGEVARADSIKKYARVYQYFDSLYNAQRDIIENHGFDSCFPGYKDSLAKHAAAVVAYKVTQEDSTAKAKQAHVDTVAEKVGMKVAAQLYIAALENFTKEYNDIQKGTWASISESDSAAFIAAAKALGVAKAAYLGFEDSLVLYTISEKKVVENVVPFSKLDPKGFVLKAGSGDKAGQVTCLYGGSGYGEFAEDVTVKESLSNAAWYVLGQNGNDAFIKIAQIAYKSPENAYNNRPGQDASTGWDAGFQTKLTASAFAGPYKDYYSKDNILAFTCSQTDTISWYKDMVASSKNFKATAVYPLDTVRANSVADYGKAIKATNTARGKVAIAWSHFLAVEGKYIDMYEKFFGGLEIKGKPEYVAKALKPYKFNYTRATFEGEDGNDNCVYFPLEDLAGYAKNARYIRDKEFEIVIENIPGVDKGYWYIFDATPDYPVETLTTLYKKVLFYKQKYAVLSNWTSVEDQLAEIEEAVNAIDELHKTAIKDAAEALAANKAALDSLCGDEDADINVLKLFQLSKGNILGGAWNLKGLLKTWADELAPNFPAVVTENLKVIFIGREYVEFYKKLNGKIQEVFNTPLTSYRNAVECLKNGYKNQIEEQNKRIVIFQKGIERIKAGYDKYTIAVNALKEEIAVLEVLLADAKVKLDYFKSVYDQLIAAYLK